MKKIILVGVCSLLVVQSAYAGQHKAKDGGKQYQRSHMEGMMDDIISELGLSPEQEAKIKELKESMSEEKKEAYARKKKKYRAMKAELDKADTDREKVDALIEELVGLEREKLQLRARQVLAIKEVLSPEQYETLQNKIEIKKEVRKELWKMKKARGKSHESYRQ